MRNYGMIWMVSAAALCAGCGDAETDDRRGYTKAPLERPAPFIEAERPGPLRELGVPNRPRPVVLQLEAQASG